MGICACGCGRELPLVKYGNRRPDGSPRLRESTATYLRGHGSGGERPNAWKGSSVSYNGLHLWLRNNYPKTGACEHCSSACKRTEYALRKGCNYSRSRDDYLELCKACHNRYDGVGGSRWIGVTTALSVAGDAPLCKCGCGNQVTWHAKKARWHVYTSGHYNIAEENKRRVK